MLFGRGYSPGWVFLSKLVEEVVSCFLAKPSNAEWLVQELSCGNYCRLRSEIAGNWRCKSEIDFESIVTVSVFGGFGYVSLVTILVRPIAF